MKDSLAPPHLILHHPLLVLAQSHLLFLSHLDSKDNFVTSWLDFGLIARKLRELLGHNTWRWLLIRWYHWNLNHGPWINNQSSYQQGRVKTLNIAGCQLFDSLQLSVLTCAVNNKYETVSHGSLNLHAAHSHFKIVSKLLLWFMKEQI